MAAERDYIDIEDEPSIVDLATRARATGRSIELRQGGEPIGVFQPRIPTESLARHLTPEELDPFRRSAGAWKGLVDADALKAWIVERRQHPSRSSAES